MADDGQPINPQGDTQPTQNSNRVAVRSDGRGDFAVSGGDWQTMVARLRLTSQQVKFAQGVDAKSAQAWKYPNFKIVRHQSLHINGRLYTDPRMEGAGTASGAPRRLTESNFNITINTNRGVKQDPALSSNYKNAFNALAAWLSDTQNLFSILVVGPEPKKKKKTNVYNDHFRGDRLPDVYKEHSVNATPEDKNGMGRAHAHIHLYISHYSCIQINLPVFRAVALEVLNMNLPPELKLPKIPWLTVFMHEQRDWQTVQAQYIHKEAQDLKDLAYVAP